MDLKPSNVTADKLERIRTATSMDPVLSNLNSVTMTGWPDKRKSVPEEIRGFWSYREEITTDNGVLFKRDQVIVPSSLRAEILRKIHKAHQGSDSSIRRWWPTVWLSWVLTVYARLRICLGQVLTLSQSRQWKVRVRSENCKEHIKEITGRGPLHRLAGVSQYTSAGSRLFPGTEINV